jgi:hypothetical protein
MTITRRTLGLLSIWSAIAIRGAKSQSQSSWVVELDEAVELFRTLNEAYINAGAPIFVDGLGFSVNRTGSFTTSTPEKRDLVDRWQRRVVRLLEGEGLAEVDRQRLEQETGLTYERMRRMVIKAQPFGGRDLAEDQMGRHIHFLMNEEPLTCPAGGGVMAAFVMAFYSVADVQSEYGNIMVMVLGAGDCGPHNPDARRSARRIKRILARSARPIVERQ